MKNFRTLCLFPFFFIYHHLMAQTIGDYRTSTTSVPWSTASAWQTWDGSKWVTASSAPGSSNDVYIQAGHTATLTSNQSCNALYISTGTTSATAGAEGLVAMQGNTLSVNGKLSCYFGSVDIALNSTSALALTYTTSVHNPIITKSSGGVLKLVGNSRNITNAGEWGIPGTAGSSSLFDIEITMNTGQTATFQTSVKAANWIFTSGTTDMGTNRIAPDNGGTGQGDISIGVDAVLISSATGTGSSSVISQTGTTSTGRAGTLTINGLLKLLGNSPHIECTSITMGNKGTVDYARSGSQNFVNSIFTGANILLNYANIILSGAGTKTTLASQTTNIVANGSLTMNGGALAVGASGTFMVSSTGTTLGYSGSASQTATASEWNSNFQNLLINNAAGVSLGSLTRSINGTLTLASGPLSNLSNFSLGNGATIVRTGGSLNAAPAFGSSVNVIYNQHSGSISSGNELPVSTTVLNNLTINNGNGVTLLAAKTVNGLLTFTNGILTTNASNLLTIETTGSATGFSDASFVNGPLAWNSAGMSKFTFPTGKGGTLRTISVTPSSSNTTTFIAEYFNSPYGNTTSFSSPITRVSSIDYFELSRSTSGAPADAMIELTWGSNSGVYTPTVGELTIARFNGSSWVDETGTGSGDATSGTITTNSAVSNFGVFALANSNTNKNPLPVKLLYFRAKSDKRLVTLEWATAIEINCLGFEVEKSEDGVNFSKFGFIKTKATGGNSNQNLYYSITDYLPGESIQFYRLKQVDYDGKFECSPIVQSHSSQNFDWKISDGTFSIYNKEAGENVLEIINLNGRVIYSIHFINNCDLNVNDLTPGFYCFRLNDLKPVMFYVK